MRYPIITQSKCQSLAAQMHQGLTPAVEPHVKPQGLGRDFDMVRMAGVATYIHRNVLERYQVLYHRDRDRLEGRAAPILFEALECVDPAVLDDPGFWRYLSLAQFWPLIEWREEGAFEKGNYLKYVDGKRSTECVLTRMYLRVQALDGTEYGHLAWVLPHATDFWRSHIIRVRTGTAPPVTRALVRRYRDDRIPTPDLRELAKRLNRIWTNVVLSVYDDEDAKSLVRELWPK